MSTVVAVNHAGRCAIASDRQTTVGSTPLPDCSTKIVRWRNGYIGVAGSRAYLCALQAALNHHGLPPGELRNANEVFDLFRWLHDNAFAGLAHDSDYMFASSFLVVNPHGIFAVDYVCGVMPVEHYWAEGSGTDYALGALGAVTLAMTKPMSAEDLARIGVLAAAQHDIYTSKDLDVESVEIQI